MTDQERIIRDALQVAGEVWQAYKEVDDPSGSGALGDVETRKWADVTSIPFRERLWELQDEAGLDWENVEEARIVGDVRALEIAILLYISRGGTRRGLELVEIWSRVGHHLQRWEVTLPVAAV